MSASVEKLCVRLEAVAATLTEPEDPKLTDCKRRLGVKLQELSQLEARLAALTREYAGDLSRIARTLSDSRFERLPDRDRMQRLRDHVRGTANLLESTGRMIAAIRDRHRALSALSVQGGAEGQLVELIGQVRGNLERLPESCAAVVGELEILDRAYRDSKEFATVYAEVR